MLTVVEILSSGGGIATPWQEDKHAPVTDLFAEWKSGGKMGLKTLHHCKKFTIDDILCYGLINLLPMS